MPFQALRPSSRQQAAASGYVSHTMRRGEPIQQTAGSSDHDSKQPASIPTFIYEYRLTKIEDILVPKSRGGLITSIRGYHASLRFRKQVKALRDLLHWLGNIEVPVQFIVSLVAADRTTAEERDWTKEWAEIRSNVRLEFTVTENCQDGIVHPIQELEREGVVFKLDRRVCHVNREFFDVLGPPTAV